MVTSVRPGHRPGGVPAPHALSGRADRGGARKWPAELWFWLRCDAVAIGLLFTIPTSTCLALIWAYTVPIFQGPDEGEHLDYALSLNHHRGLFWVTPESAIAPHGGAVHPLTRHFGGVAATGTMAFRPDGRVPPGYGTAAYFEALDRTAPSREEIRLTALPSALVVYPFGYYALLAAWIEILRAIRDSATFIFFGARLLSVVLLAISLLLAYLTLRQLRLSGRFSLLVTTIVGLFPLTSFVSSYVQPDNLAGTLALLSFYLTLIARRRLQGWGVLGALGLTFGALAVTKPHLFACVLPACLAALGAEGWRSSRPARWWLWAVPMLTAPAVVLFSVYLWSVWGTTTPHLQEIHQTARPGALERFFAALPGGFLEIFEGRTHLSFWGIFGWMDTPIVFIDPTITALARHLIRAGTALALVLVVARLIQVSGKLARVARRRSVGTALRIAVSNPLVNSCLLFTAAMFGLYFRHGNQFGYQGRHWWPLLVPIFLMTLVYAGRALPPAIRRRYTLGMSTALLLYGLIGGYFALSTIHNRYYGPPPGSTVISTAIAAPLGDFWTH